MLKLLDKEETHVIVKMDIFTYEEIKKKSNFNNLVKEADSSESFESVDDLFNDLNN